MSRQLSWPFTPTSVLQPTPPPAPRVVPPRVVPTVKINEKAWQHTFLDYAKLKHWDLRYHTQHSLGSEPGFPDWLLVRERVVFVELKGDGGKLSPHQAKWVEGLRAAGAEVYVWWPSDWAEVQRVLD